MDPPPDLRRQLSKEGKGLLKMAIGAPSPPGSFSCVVCTMNGDLHTVNGMLPSFKIEDLKRGLQKVSGVPADCQQLFITTQEGALEDTPSLRSLGIDEETEIFLMVEPGFGFDPENCHTGNWI